MTSVKLLISGKVQGVFYRASAKEIAERLNILGWVKNTAEGEVEIMACGSQENVNQFIEWCKKGPAGAIVTHIKISESDEKCPNEFKIVRK